MLGIGGERGLCWYCLYVFGLVFYSLSERNIYLFDLFFIDYVYR